MIALVGYWLWWVGCLWCLADSIWCFHGLVYYRCVYLYFGLMRFGWFGFLFEFIVIVLVVKCLLGCCYLVGFTCGFVRLMLAVLLLSWVYFADNFVVCVCIGCRLFSC